MVLRGEVNEAGERLANIVEKFPKSRAAIISLGSLLNQVGWEGHEIAWTRILKQWSWFDRPEKINLGNFPFFALGVELALVCEPRLADLAIKNVYFPFIWKYERKDKKDYDPIFYWHVPKTGGTSVNYNLSKVWYRSDTQFLPSYTTRGFFSYVVENHDGVLPYISSAHMSSSDFPIKSIERYRKLVVLRDPKERALSAWRQYRENPASRLIVLPQHGFVWDFFPVLDFKNWLKTAPLEVVNPLSWTFSGYSSPQSLGLSRAIDDAILIKNLDSFGDELLQSLGVENSSEGFRVSKNITNKSIKEGEIDWEGVVRFLNPDYSIYNQLKTTPNALV
ncbi:hypothetical protein MDG893_01245 [Marinobacter algicola DG893]|uniref:Sulfotransferase domain-containing protein n=1 Tax=Marinobacter algicola DG893 TaxID=443152 RepID=A6F1I9_9GAMM|nr:hypothetical protein MDG893_01245 [Marinobacter algicola DG893]